jgi:uncharacterized protein
MTLYEEIYNKVFHLLHTKLPSFLTYHSHKHTAYVLKQAEIISENEGIGEDDLFLVRIASLFHDIGFVKQYKDHEEAGCDIAREVLQTYSFDPMNVNEICGMIMATKIPQTPATLNEKIVCDADLEYLGTDLFYKVSQFLFHEMHYLDPDLNLMAFNELQVKFMKAHTFHTDYCKQHREAKKAENLRELIETMSVPPII